MPTIIQELIDSLAHPPIRHAAMVHMPIAFSALGLCLLVLLLFTGGRSRCLRWSTVALLLLAAGLAYLTSITGKLAEDHLALDVVEQFRDPLEAHEWYGQRAWVPLAVAGILTAFTAMPGWPARTGFLVLAIMAGMFCCVWLALAAHHGGQLVYAHGVGVGTVPDRSVVDQTRQEAAPGIQVIEEGENP